MKGVIRRWCLISIVSVSEEVIPNAAVFQAEREPALKRAQRVEEDLAGITTAISVSGLGFRHPPCKGRAWVRGDSRPRLSG